MSESMDVRIRIIFSKVFARHVFFFSRDFLGDFRPPEVREILEFEGLSITSAASARRYAKHEHADPP